MMTAFGTEEPEEYVVLSDTFAQIFTANIEFVNFSNVGSKRKLEASRNWIGNPGDLARMLRGGLIPYPKFAPNACRIETTYRYLFDEIWFGPSGKITCFSKDGVIPDVDWDHTTDGPFLLILVTFGRYYWDEIPSLAILKQ